MMKKFAELEYEVLDWAQERGLLDESNSGKQLLKTVSEVGELADAFIKVDEDNIKEELGDVLVCLIIFANQLGLDPTDCLTIAYNKISGRKGKTVGGVFIKDE